MDGSRVILECLIKEGVDTIFGYPGGAVIPLYDALYDYTDKLYHVRTSHEQGAVHGADGYARSCGKVGVCFLTSGPGATNAITGIATAYMDSSPLVCFSGQVPTALLGKDSFQEIDITGVTLSVTKHNFLIRRAKDLPKTIRKAFEIANSGRKGPVLIDIPKDLMLTEVDFDMDDYLPSNFENPLKSEYELKEEYENKKKVDLACDLIRESKRPIIYAGGGVKSANEEKLLVDFAKKIDTPVLNTIMGLGDIDRRDDLSLGLLGMHGSKEGNLAISNSDLIIAIGARFSDRVIGKSSEFAKNAKVIHIDIDPSEINKNIKSEVDLVGDLTLLLKELYNKVNKKNNSSWKKEIKTYEDKENIMSEDEFHPQNILSLVNKKMGDNTVAVTDVGQHQMWTAKYWNFSLGKSFITSSGLGTMGFGLGAAIGAKIGVPSKNVVLVTGDGSFRMNCNEMATISTYKIPVLILLLNNSTLGMVRQWQKLFSNERYSQTDVDPSVDYVMLAKAYGIDGYKATNMEELKNVLSEINIDKPVFLECVINTNYDVYPIVPPNETLLNLICN
ncbi:biosynthetic-type acetolactate synthase large subunit [Terrisporobacter mayombei]|uniref:Acetolactate synthase n=1 Tax=Terrisporobacter mayombei TaxID=1541 RepID=A0ABY9Q8E0_9FIRM|nr:biosynthetic-type acetolactate synthase large subunit [Terrisporobacter mayombei]MCC3869578.1 biosynthetic-type acetolactate synthase large subunit [Terrisporobacter mayombei]WMT83484.1 Acetolactate synthase large subunit [Terrisporobacter mayombei]